MSPILLLLPVELLRNVLGLLTVKAVVRLDSSFSNSTERVIYGSMLKNQRIECHAFATYEQMTWCWKKELYFDNIEFSAHAKFDMVSGKEVLEFPTTTRHINFTMPANYSFFNMVLRTYLPNIRHIKLIRLKDADTLNLLKELSATNNINKLVSFRLNGNFSSIGNDPEFIQHMEDIFECNNVTLKTISMTRCGHAPHQCPTRIMGLILRAADVCSNLCEIHMADVMYTDLSFVSALLNSRSQISRITIWRTGRTGEINSTLWRGEFACYREVGLVHANFLRNYGDGTNDIITESDAAVKHHSMIQFLSSIPTMPITRLRLLAYIPLLSQLTIVDVILPICASTLDELQLSDKDLHLMPTFVQRCPNLRVIVLASRGGLHSTITTATHINTPPKLSIDAFIQMLSAPSSVQIVGANAFAELQYEHLSLIFSVNPIIKLFALRHCMNVEPPSTARKLYEHNDIAFDPDHFGIFHRRDFVYFRSLTMSGWRQTPTERYIDTIDEHDLDNLFLF
jgi:hypothetical protein